MVRNHDLTSEILLLKRQGKTEKEISVQLKKHRNTISRHINWLRNNVLLTPEEIVNKIDDKLNNEIDNMEHRDLINYRRILLPQRIEEDVRVTELKVHATWDNKWNQSPSPSTNINHIRDNETSTTTMPDTASSPADADGAKTTAPSTKQSNTASQTEA